MSDQAERWRNVAQAAQWLAEGRPVEKRSRGWGYEGGWSSFVEGLEGIGSDLLTPHHEYRLKPEPPKPREFCIPLHPESGLLWEDYRLYMGIPVWVRVREVLE